VDSESTKFIKGKLMTREWLLLAVLLGLLTCFSLSSVLSRPLAKSSLLKEKEEYTQALIDINVSGAVISPGVYKFPPGISIKEILGQVGLTAKADRKKINFKRKVFASVSLEVPEKIISKQARIEKKNI